MRFWDHLPSVVVRPPVRPHLGQFSSNSVKGGLKFVKWSSRTRVGGGGWGAAAGVVGGGGGVTSYI